MFVACSTFCFARQSLDDALKTIAELEFSKFDLAVRSHGPHLRPAEVVADLGHVAHRLRAAPGLAPAAFALEIDAASEDDYLRQFKAVCRLARVTAAPLVSVPAAESGSPLEAEVARLTRLTAHAEGDGVQLALETRIGSLTEDPDTAVTLCERVPNLGLALDPSHYVAGPHQGKSYDHVFRFVRHVRLRDTGRGPNQFQLRVGQGEIEYGRIVSQLARHNYERLLTVDIREIADAPFAMEPEVRKLKYLLESLV